MEGEPGCLINVQPFYLKIQLRTVSGCFIKYARAGQIEKKEEEDETE